MAEIPRGPQWQYEPKWDGFRCLLGRDGSVVVMRSKSGQDLARYFPEIARAATSLPENRYILDGELVLPSEGGLSFDHLLQRIHPAESRNQEAVRRDAGALHGVRPAGKECSRSG